MQVNGVWLLQLLVDMLVVEFCDWQVLLENCIGVVFNEQCWMFLQVSLSVCMCELGIGDYYSYYCQVIDGLCGVVEWVILLDCLIVQEICFFCYFLFFELFECYLGECLCCEGMLWFWVLWSVGCFSGEEFYLLVMCVVQVLCGQEWEDFFGVIGMDISFYVLQWVWQVNYLVCKLE